MGRIAGVGRAAAANWRRRHVGFPASVGGTETSPEFDRSAVVAWLLAHGDIAVPTEAPSAVLVVAGAGGGTRQFRLEDPHLLLADDADDEDRLSGWFTDEDGDALAALSAGTFGLTVKHLAAPGAPPLAVLGEARVIDRFRSGSEKPAPHADLAGRPASAAPPPRARPGWSATGWRTPARGRSACAGGTTAAASFPLSWRPDHGATSPAMEWHPGGGVRCTGLSLGRLVGR
ncbi:hypothetical protein ACWFQ8_18225 [Streptomyces sp. NPDC055254]